MSSNADVKRDGKKSPSPDDNPPPNRFDTRLLLRKARRIKKNAEIRKMLREGKRWNGQIISIIHQENRLDYSRCAVIVPKKTGSAVQRNRIKRQLRALFRKEIARLPRHRDLLIRINPHAHATAAEIKGALRKWAQISGK